MSVTGIGPSAVLKAVKALALVADYVKDDKLTVSTVPRFVDMRLGEGADSERTAVRLLVRGSKAA